MYQPYARPRNCGGTQSPTWDIMAGEKQAITKLDSTDFEQAERERWRVYIAQHHERLDLDWASLKIVSTRSAS